MSVTVSNANEAPSFTSTAPTSVPENTSGTIYTASASDPDAGDTVTFSIDPSSTDADDFSITANGALSFQSPPDFEDEQDADQDNTYVVGLVATDGGGATATQTVTVSVTNVIENQAPTFSSTTASTSVPENSTGTVFTASASDADDDTLTYSVVGGADADKFNIDSSSGALTFKSAPDYENPADVSSPPDNVYEVQIQADDSNGGTATQTVSVTVTDLFENSVNIIDLDGSEFRNISDWDVLGGSFTNGELDFLTGGNAAHDLLYPLSSKYYQLGYHAKYVTDGPRASDHLELSGESLFDYYAEKQGQYWTVGSGATDIRKLAGGGAMGSQGGDRYAVFEAFDGLEEFTLSATRSKISNFKFGKVLFEAFVGENDDRGAIFAQLDSHIDPTDYQLSSDYFQIEGSALKTSPLYYDDWSGEVVYWNLIDYEVEDHLFMTFKKEQGLVDEYFTVGVQVVDDNESPSFFSDIDVSISPSAHNGDRIAKLVATDPDIRADSDDFAYNDDFNDLTYSIVSGNELDFFAINAANGEVLVNPQVDLLDLQGQQFVLQGLVTDGGDLSDTTELKISINDPPAPKYEGPIEVNEGAQSIDLSPYFADPNADDMTFYFGDKGYDEPSASIEQTTGILSFNSPLDFEANSDFTRDNVYDLEILVDDGLAVTSQVISLRVKNLNDNEPEILHSLTYPVFPFPNLPVATLFPFDADGDELEISILTSDFSDLFYLRDTTIYTNADLSQYFDPVELVELPLSVNVSDGTTSISQPIFIDLKGSRLQDFNVMEGDEGPNDITGTYGNDIINGLGGNDEILQGNRGHDIIFGGDGNDWLHDGMGSKILLAESGDDYITFNGGGTYWLEVYDEFGNLTDLREETGRVFVDSGTGDGWADFSGSNNVYFGADGVDKLTSNYFVSGYNFINTNSGVDQLFLAGESSSPASIDIKGVERLTVANFHDDLRLNFLDQEVTQFQVGIGGYPEEGVFGEFIMPSHVPNFSIYGQAPMNKNGVFSVYGNAEDNFMFGSANSEYFYGNDGDDFITSGGIYLGGSFSFVGDYRDMLFGGSGNDELVGGTGQGYLDGGPGDDSLGGAKDMRGGEGRDTFKVSHRQGTVLDLEHGDYLMVENVAHGYGTPDNPFVFPDLDPASYVSYQETAEGLLINDTLKIPLSSVDFDFEERIDWDSESWSYEGYEETYYTANLVIDVVEI